MEVSVRRTQALGTGERAQPSGQGHTSQGPVTHHGRKQGAGRRSARRRGKEAPLSDERRERGQRENGPKLNKSLPFQMEFNWFWPILTLKPERNPVPRHPSGLRGQTAYKVFFHLPFLVRAPPPLSYQPRLRPYRPSIGGQEPQKIALSLSQGET